jgi:phosphatidylserine synthase
MILPFLFCVLGAILCILGILVILGILFPNQIKFNELYRKHFKVLGFLGIFGGLSFIGNGIESYFQTAFTHVMSLILSFLFIAVQIYALVITVSIHSRKK